MQNKQQPQPQSQHQSLQASPDDQDSDLSSINQEQLAQMSTTLKKFKQIFKKQQLTNYKKQNPKINAVFCQMSQFFHIKHNYVKNVMAKTKQQRVLLRQQRLKTTVNQQTVKAKVKNIPKNTYKQLKSPLGYATSIPIEEQAIAVLCHICKTKYTQIHSFYGYFCPPCASLNFSKRRQSANLKGLTALVTGGRIKIGFEICLKLLRDGAMVYATSRFANDTLLRYQSQKDYNQWKDRLHIIECDFLSQKQVDHLINYLLTHVAKLDILINNAAQTIVRPKQFYKKEIQHARLMLTNNEEANFTSLVKTPDSHPFPSVFANQIVIKPEEIDLQQLDQFGQPTDKRAVNTWVQPIEDVSLLDCYTTQVINSIVPFHLISKLKVKMIGSSPSWVVNVSSMEGVFQRPFKSQFHPHTNMAKAALNMITRTSARQFASEGVFMNSVDTGWVTNQNPYGIAQNMTENHNFKCPLDCVDGAMRVLDPIYQGVVSSQFPFGQFLKNYHPSSW